jgi:hypothetical protein
VKEIIVIARIGSRIDVDDGVPIKAIRSRKRAYPL